MCVCDCVSLLGVVIEEVQHLCKALLFFGLADVCDQVMGKTKAFVDSLEKLEYPVPPVYPLRMLGPHAKDLPQLLNRMRLLATRPNAVETSVQIAEQDPRLSWAQFRNETSF